MVVDPCAGSGFRRKAQVAVSFKDMPTTSFLGYHDYALGNT